MQLRSLMIASNLLGTGASPAQDSRQLALLITNPPSGNSAHAKYCTSDLQICRPKRLAI